MIQMFRIDIGDNGDRSGKFRKGAVALVRFDNHPFTRTHARVGSVFVDDAAIDDGGIKISFFQHRADHGGRRCLAVRATNRNRHFQAHQFREHFRAADNGKFRGACRGQFGIVGFNSG